MKQLKMLVLAVTVAFSSVLSAGTNPEEKAEPKTVIETVSELLKNPDFQLSQDQRALVNLAINHNGEMVVLSVDTDDKNVENFIKSRLNYKKLSKEAIGQHKTFKLPVRLIKD